MSKSKRKLPPLKGVRAASMRGDITRPVKAWAVIWYNGQFVSDGKLPVLYRTKKAARDAYVSFTSTQIVRVTIAVDVT